MNNLKSSTKLQSLSDSIENIRKIATNLFLFGAVLTVAIVIAEKLIFSKKRLLIEPFKVPASFVKDGYSGQILTLKLIDRIQEIKNGGIAFYGLNAEIPSWQNEVEEIKGAVENQTYTRISNIMTFLFGRTPAKATGEIVFYSSKPDTLQLHFRLEGQQDMLVYKGPYKIDSLINIVAEFVMQSADPYYLIAWYRKNGQYDKGLKLAQQLLNQNDEENAGIALQMRGALYLQHATKDYPIIDSDEMALSKQTLLVALDKIKKSSHWSKLNYNYLTYNDLGLIHYYLKQYDESKKYYALSLKENPKSYGTYRNFGNVLWIEYGNSKIKSVEKLDSSFNFYEKAIQYDRGNYEEYLSLILTLYDKNQISRADSNFRICTEMERNNYFIYYHMARIQANYKKYDLAQNNLNTALKLCKNKDTIDIRNMINYLSIRLSKSDSSKLSKDSAIVQTQIPPIIKVKPGFTDQSIHTNKKMSPVMLTKPVLLNKKR